MTRTKKLKPIPEFASYEEEANFWDTHDLTDYVDFSKPIRVVYKKNLNHGVTVRFSPKDLNDLRIVSAKQGLGVTTFIRMHMLQLLHKMRRSSRV